LRWAIAVGVAVVIGIGIVLMFLLTQATNNREFYERNYGRLFVLNMVVAGVLLAVILWVFVRLASRLRRGKFGSRLLVKLAAIFALVGLVPGALIYVVSYQFVSRSIETWFDVKVEGALDSGLNLGRVRAAVNERRALEDEAQAQYGQTVLRAMEDLENSLSRYRTSRERVERLTEASVASERAAELARLRFREGVTDFLQVLDSERTQLESQDQLARSRTDAAIAYAALYKAVGGRWQ